MEQRRKTHELLPNRVARIIAAEDAPMDIEGRRKMMSFNQFCN